MDRRKETGNLPFLIVDLGTHDVILGCKWLEHYNVMVDSRQRRLVWPLNHPKTLSFASPIRTSLKKLLEDKPRIEKVHQKDVFRRYKLFKKEDKSLLYGARVKKGSVHEKKSLLQFTLRKYHQQRLKYCFNNQYFNPRNSSP